MKQKVFAIVGPTASGKTDYAIDLAKQIDGEIVSADSRLVYKGFNILCAKPTIEEMSGIKHYLIDVVEPEIDYSAANYCDDANVAIKEILNKKKVPIIVGGTGLYFRLLLEGFDMPRVEPNYKLRNKLESYESTDLHNMLKELDEKSAQKIHFNNKVKIIRAIEVCKATGKPMSEVAGIRECDYEVEWIGLNYENREDLYNRINLRVDKMIELGAINETKKLLEKHGRVMNFVNTIGYKEILGYLDKEYSLDYAIEELKKNSRRYAKRQISWFRQNLNINWIIKK
jgi:tRNA dimethylallyltransferase